MIMLERKCGGKLAINERLITSVSYNNNEDMRKEYATISMIDKKNHTVRESVEFIVDEIRSVK